MQRLLKTHLFTNYALVKALENKFKLFFSIWREIRKSLILLETARCFPSEQSV